MKGLLQKVMEASDCGRCLDDMELGQEPGIPVAGNQPNLNRLNRMF